jgi:anti-sigma factor RsiW
MTKKRTRSERVLLSAARLAALAVTFVFTIAAARPFPANPPQKQRDIIEEALVARNDAVIPLAVVGPRTLGDAVARNTVLTAALSMQTKVPDLARMGYQLAGMQILASVSGGKAIELLYRARDGQMITLYLRRSHTAPRFDQFESKGIRVCIWQDDVMATVVTGKMSAPEMQRVAGLAYAGL